MYLSFDKYILTQYPILMSALQIFPLYLCTTLCMCMIGYVLAADSGIPASKAKDFEHVYTPTTGSEWRTYKQKSTGETHTFNPKTSELWFNPVKKKYEPVLREDGSPDPKENSVTTQSGQASVQKTEKVFNPVTKKFEEVLVEVAPQPQQGPAIQYPKSLDNGLPISTAANWDQVINDSTGSEWRTYKNNKTGQVVAFNPKTSELWFNPVKQKWEPVLREQTSQQTYIKQVARELIFKNKPAFATGWKCNFSGTVHNSPNECQDPDQGGIWIQ